MVDTTPSQAETTGDWGLRISCFLFSILAPIVVFGLGAMFPLPQYIWGVIVLVSLGSWAFPQWPRFKRAAKAMLLGCFLHSIAFACLYWVFSHIRD